MPLSLYISYPFCKDFRSYRNANYVKIDSALEQKYFTALEKELLLAKNDIEPDERIVDTIYIGGGTPALVDTGRLTGLFNVLKNHFYLRREAEISLEMNPELTDRKKLTSLQSIGINRPVFRIYSFNSKLLQPLKRIHRLKDSHRAIYLARALGFDNFSIDMTFGIPRQTGRMLTDDLNQLTELAPPHISYHRLTVERRTPLDKKVKSGKLKIPGKKLIAAMYSAIHNGLKGHNYFRYEVFSYARPGFECRHSLRYWARSNYLGLGPAAHGIIGDYSYANRPDLSQYLNELSDNKRPLTKSRGDTHEHIKETIRLSMRTARGIDKIAFKRKFGPPVEDYFNFENLRYLKQRRLIVDTDEHYRLTEAGFILAEKVIARLIR